MIKMKPYYLVGFPHKHYSHTENKGVINKNITIVATSVEGEDCGKKYREVSKLFSFFSFIVLNDGYTGFVL